ncbi:MAG: QueT transporter family protein [Candidatus Helarchaeota archaeon]
MNEKKLSKYNKNTSIYISLIAIISALYVVLVILIPIAWDIPQVRVADALFTTVFFFGYPGTIGITIGCILANIIGGLGLIDIIFGSLANLLAGSLGYYLFNKIKDLTGKKRHIYIQLIILLMNLINTFIVGTYLPFLLNMPFWLTYLGIFTGSLISMNLLGYLLFIGLERAGIHKII